MNTRHTFCAFAVLIFACMLQAENAPPTISPEQAKDFVGKTVTVKGKVGGFTAMITNDLRFKVAFLTMGDGSPNGFAILMRRNLVTARDWKMLGGKEVSVTGKVEVSEPGKIVALGERSFIEITKVNQVKEVR